MTNFLKMNDLPAAFRWAIYPVAVCAVAAVVAAAPDPRGELPSERELATTARLLSARQNTVATRIAYKDALVRELAEGHLKLREVAERFEAINAESPDIAEALRMHYPHLTSLQASARSVMTLAESVRLTANERRALRGRLEHEWAALAGTSPAPRGV